MESSRRKTRKPKPTNRSASPSVQGGNRPSLENIARKIDTGEQSLDAAEIMQLQRTIGNQATLQLLQRQPSTPQKPPARRQVIQRNDFVTGEREYSESDSDDFSDDGNIRTYVEEKTDLEKGLEYLPREGAKAFLKNGDFDEFRKPLIRHLMDTIESSGEDKLSDVQYEFMTLVLDDSQIAQLEMSEKAPKLVAAAKGATRILTGDERDDNIYINYDDVADTYTEVIHVIDQAYDAEYSTSVITKQKNNGAYVVKLTRAAYFGTGVFKGQQGNLPGFDDFKKKMESDKLSWLLQDGLTSASGISKAVNERVEFEQANNKMDKAVTQKDTAGSILTGAGTAKELTSMGFSVQQGANSVAQIKQGLSDTDGGEVGKGFLGAAAEVLQSATMWFIGKAFGIIAIGADLVKAFEYHKKRRDGYREAMKRSQIDEKGQTKLKADKAEDTKKVRLGRVAYYAWRKTSRAFGKTLFKAIMKILKWIAHAVTMFSGGASAIVTESIALAADAARFITIIGEKIKGFGKWVTNKRGANRQANADELVTLAMKGDDSAIQTIMDVYPFDLVNIPLKKLLKKSKRLGKNVTEIPLPNTKDEFKQQLSKGGYYDDPKTRAALVSALSNTMKSK